MRSYLPRPFPRCEGHPRREQCKDCRRNVNVYPLSSDSVWQVWMHPWVGHGECPDYAAPYPTTTPAVANGKEATA